LDESAWKLWEDRPDKDWSFVDCVSFIIMDRRGLAQALATDRHFEQAGFDRLLK
jgi:predicted nucleic acid-binding protein